jgi:hypothetical protein
MLVTMLLERPKLFLNLIGISIEHFKELHEELVFDFENTCLNTSKKITI